MLLKKPNLNVLGLILDRERVYLQFFVKKKNKCLKLHILKIAFLAEETAQETEHIYLQFTCLPNEFQGVALVTPTH